ncbi:TetR/AcrR family transcriptional regulator [Rhizobium bangladeshense]|uniref:TetR/AcrR family transcriptional regulator n=1 Tax=Rhizobium bangladeshense TaxID=1138189 RepID=A0ABS7LLV0_9HYPH|nr:TetR/AcrR family transcriptional regulator [Rhizobium bangladeshense]MBX4869517.1 TetR/AcrR family transcriptional regulator [Rhizobium bangladeshense]MBX4874913.1 TetR/AcrR family transcriptional regulator [Rhizobium bangladeshense]MBX4885046.1 TetR/AcrR family transcriptional regulator [Rhizobium bangladeshense]MBX4902681.1 TetR/AcrR family transcriptional regulator [Rhizobium bangladeshense]MBY3592457.1 TetR/AcrR family transcriptional regulator [Rhizobium bangladeshense]
MKTVYERADIIPLLAETFRELGYEGATLSRITERTGIGKGSLYHFFPGGKEEMAGAVLADVDAWFEQAIYRPLRDDDARQAIAAMWVNVNEYFRAGGRICLVGAFALDDTRERFSSAIGDYFLRWIDALRSALMRAGCSDTEAQTLAEEGVCGIQGALVLSRALRDGKVFTRSLETLANRLETATR